MFSGKSFISNHPASFISAGSTCNSLLCVIAEKTWMVSFLNSFLCSIEPACLILCRDKPTYSLISLTTACSRLSPGLTPPPTVVRRELPYVCLMSNIWFPQVIIQRTPAVVGLLKNQYIFAIG